MFILLIREAVLKAALLALGVAAVRGCHWAFVVFIVVLAIMIAFDAVLAMVAIRAEKDIARLDS